MSAAEAFREAIQDGWTRLLEHERRTPVAHPYVYASAWRPCERRMVYELTVPDRQPPHDAELLARFRRGDKRERDLVFELDDIGRIARPPFRVIGQQQRFELKGRGDLGTIIAGKVDARLEQNGHAAPVEIKTWAPTIVDRIEEYEDLHENPWTRSGAMQMLAYLYGANEEFGFMVLDRSGIPLVLLVELEKHLDKMEEFLSRAERVVRHQRAGTLPDFLVGDAAECRRCGFFGNVCNPPLSYGEVQVLTDPELEALLEEREAVKEAGRKFERLDKAVKARLRGIEDGIAGPFTISGRWGKQARLDLPESLKKQYTVTDPKGRFTLEITRVSDPPERKDDSCA